MTENSERKSRPSGRGAVTERDNYPAEPASVTGAVTHRGLPEQLVTQASKRYGPRNAS